MKHALPILALCLSLSASCSDDDVVPADAGIDGAATDALGDGEVPFTLPPGGAGSAKLGQTLTAGQVRAGEVKDKAHLLPGIKVEGQLGDFKIYNDKVAFIIQGARAGDGIAPYGGEVLDAQHLGLPGDAGHSLLGETMLGVMTNAVKPVSVGVVADGSDGKEALIRVIGAPAPVPLLDSFIPGVMKELPIHYVIDYALAPGAAALQIRIRLFNKKKTAVSNVLGLVALTAGDGLDYYLEQYGFDADKGGPQGYLAAVGDRSAYALVSEGSGKLTPIVLRSGIWITSSGTINVPPAGEFTRKLALLLSAGEPEALRRAIRKHRGEAEPTSVSGKVSTSTGAAVAGARVHVTSADGKTYVTMARTDAAGAYKLALAAGDYRLQALADGRAPSAAVTLKVGSAPATQDLALGGSASVSFSAQDGAGADLPVKVTVQPTSPVTPPPTSFGEAAQRGGAALIVYHAGGVGSMDLPPGSYSVTASRGFEYEIDVQQITLTSGESKTLSFKLKRSVSSVGQMCGDFHVHAMRSYDTSDSYALKVRAMVAEGLEIPISTEHDYISDFNPTITKLGLQKWIRGVVGEEITTGQWGHFNAFPISADPSKPNAGALSWFDKAIPQLFAEVHATWPAAVLQINHPRSTSFGYFHRLGYDPQSGKVKVGAQWSKSFDVVELFNEDGWDVNVDGSVRDWFSLLDRGLLLAATGNSDSHHVSTLEVGYPRNCVALGTDEPAKLDLAKLAAAVRGQRLVVSGGALISASVGSTTVGGVADVSATRQAALKIKVQAPTWVDLDTLEIFTGGVSGGKLEQTITLDASTVSPTDPVVRYEGTVTLTLSKDTWVVVVAHGSKKLSPVVFDKQPFGMTNPIYLDVDGNGKYDPPFSF